MTKLIPILIFIFLLSSCGGGGGIGTSSAEKYKKELSDFKSGGKLFSAKIISASESETAYMFSLKLKNEENGKEYTTEIPQEIYEKIAVSESMEGTFSCYEKDGEVRIDFEKIQVSSDAKAQKRLMEIVSGDWKSYSFNWTQLDTLGLDSIGLQLSLPDQIEAKVLKMVNGSHRLTFFKIDKNTEFMMGGIFYQAKFMSNDSISAYVEKLKKSEFAGIKDQDRKLKHLEDSKLTVHGKEIIVSSTLAKMKDVYGMDQVYRFLLIPVITSENQSKYLLLELVLSQGHFGKTNQLSEMEKNLLEKLSIFNSDGQRVF